MFLRNSSNCQCIDNLMSFSGVFIEIVVQQLIDPWNHGFKSHPVAVLQLLYLHCWELECNDMSCLMFWPPSYGRHVSRIAYSLTTDPKNLLHLAVEPGDVRFLFFDSSASVYTSLRNWIWALRLVSFAPLWLENLKRLKGHTLQV